MPDPAANLPEFDEPSARLPEAMQRDLRLLYGPAADAMDDAAALDDAVLRQARSHFQHNAVAPARQGGALQLPVAPPYRDGAPLYRFRAPLAAAAALLLAMTIALVVLNSSPDSTLSISAPPLVSGDVNGDGKLDILDAYLLARRLQQSGTLDAQWDFTRDGRVNDDDVNELTAHAVRLRQPVMGVGS